MSVLKEKGDRWESSTRRHEKGFETELPHDPADRADSHLDSDNEDEEGDMAMDVSSTMIGEDASMNGLRLDGHTRRLG
jgi:hypothetical protein